MASTSKHFVLGASSKCDFLLLSHSVEFVSRFFQISNNPPTQPETRAHTQTQKSSLEDVE